MGLFDMFGGGGGGSLAIQVQSPSATPGSTVTGAVAFQGGSKAQQITNIKIKLVMEQKTTEMAVVNGQKVAQERSNSRDLFPFFEIAPAFQSTPGQATQFPFTVQLPTGLLNSAPRQVIYRFVATADIDNAIDPGAHVEIQVVGGTDVAQAQPQEQTQQAAAKPQQPHDPSGHAGKFDSAAKGVAQDPYAKGGKFDASAKGAAPDPYAKGGKFDASGKRGASDPYAKGGAAPDPYAKGGAAADPYAKGGATAPSAKGAPTPGLQIGAYVNAQHPSGQWYPGRVVAMQNGLIGVDWDDAKIGESTWVQPQQVAAR